jgi:hypothetical protein
MKNKLLITFLVMYSVALNAQITITSADMSATGNSYVTVNDDSVTSYGAAGINQTWDFSSWINDYFDTASFVSPSNLSGALFFPTATVGINSDGAGSIFMKNSATAFEILGSHVDLTGNGAVPIIYNPSITFLTFPSTYQTSYNSNSSYTLTFAIADPDIDSVHIKSSTNYTSIIDGWGTISTPAYSNVSAIRQCLIEIGLDSAFVLPTDSSTWVYQAQDIDTSYTYRWFSNSHTYPLAEISFSEGDSVYFASYLIPNTVGVNELAKNTNSVSVFPSPASDKVSFKGIDSDAYLIIFDVNGKLVEQSLLKKNTTINIANYNNGIYFYNVAPLNGTPVSKGKFVVEK